jgi:transposase-like protein
MEEVEEVTEIYCKHKTSMYNSFSTMILGKPKLCDKCARTDSETCNIHIISPNENDKDRNSYRCKDCERSFTRDETKKMKNVGFLYNMYIKITSNDEVPDRPRRGDSRAKRTRTNTKSCEIGNREVPESVKEDEIPQEDVRERDSKKSRKNPTPEGLPVV